MKKTVQDIMAMKGHEKISMLTCYDYSFASALSGSVDMLLVGDSMGNVVYGYEKTSEVTLHDISTNLQAVRKGAKDTFVVADLPFGTYNTNADALKTAKKLIASGADAVKPEGKPEIVKFLVKNNIPVLAHLGLLPQSAKKYSVIGRDKEESDKLIEQAKKMQESGAFALILESIPEPLAASITKKLKIPTIGIGAGRYTDGQVLVIYDMLGLYPNFRPRFARAYLNLKAEINIAGKKYSDDVKKGNFPSESEVYK